MFAVAVSLITGKILYISDQAASILRCKRGYFKNAKFVEFLAPQDVSVFYTSTTPYRLPSWNICNRAGEWSHSRYFSDLSVMQMQILALILGGLPSFPITFWGGIIRIPLNNTRCINLQISKTCLLVKSLFNVIVYQFSCPFQPDDKWKQSRNSCWMVNLLFTFTSNQMKTIFLHIFSSSSIKGMVLCLLSFKMFMIWILDTLIMV